MSARLEDIVIRHELAPGDLGYVMYLHGLFYRRAHGYGIGFESYVALGIHEFYTAYDPEWDRAWICEHDDHIIGSLILMHRENNAAQLRYFLVLPDYTGIGLGKRLMDLFMDFLKQCRYRSAFLWTTNEQTTAAALYKRYGFVFTDEEDSTAFGKPLREQRYELTLGGPSAPA